MAAHTSFNSLHSQTNPAAFTKVGKIVIQPLFLHPPIRVKPFWLHEDVGIHSNEVGNFAKSSLSFTVNIKLHCPQSKHKKA